MSLGPCELMGVSLAGCRTSLFIPELKIGFDAGFPFPYQLGTETFFITHGHLDHAAAIPFIISQKNLNNQKVAQFYMPESLVEPLSEIIRIWQKIESHNYSFNFIPTFPKQTLVLNQQYLVKPFKAHHRIPALGYTLFQTKKHLQKQFEGLPKEELVRLKSRGISVDEIHESPLMTFSGDTRIEFLWEEPWICDSKFLFIETTYIDERKSVEQARAWGHIHLDEVIEMLPQIKSEKIILMHISSRYSDQEAHSIIEKRIPDEYKERVLFFEGR
jgi:ribonuclease Z